VSDKLYYVNQGGEMDKKYCRTCRFFTYHIHHRSSCELFPEDFYKHRDGRALACKEFKLKKKYRRDSVN